MDLVGSVDFWGATPYPDFSENENEVLSCLGVMQKATLMFIVLVQIRTFTREVRTWSSISKELLGLGRNVQIFNASKDYFGQKLLVNVPVGYGHLALRL